MNHDLIIVRYGEIALKGKETRSRFESTLVNNIRDALRLEEIGANIRRERGRIYVSTVQIQKSITVLKKIFGIISISPAYTTKSDMDSMSEFAISLCKEKKLSQKQSFALRVTRTGNHDYSSQEVAIKLGDDIVKTTQAKVDLTKPSFELFIEIRNKESYFFTEKTRAVGGMPFNTQGKILSIIKDPESILATWYLIRRGCKAIFFCTEKSLHPLIEDFLKKWYINSKIIPINTDNNIVEIINEISNKNNCQAIVTSYRLQDIAKIEELTKQTDIPVLHPLISMENEDIKNKCNEVGIKL